MTLNTEIPIVFSANNYYVPYMAAAMQSIMENASKDRKYIFFILHREIDNINKDLLKKQVSYFQQFSIEFIDVSPYIDTYKLFTSRHITVEGYFRLLIPELLSGYQKAIYLDGDMICRVDIAQLFDIDLKDNLLAAVRDIAVAWYYSPNKTKEQKKTYSVLLGLKKPDTYFCDGMSIFNIDLFRQIMPTDKLLELAASREWQVHDQDVLNVAAEGKTLLLPYHWNLMRLKSTKYLPEHLQKEYREAEMNPKIIHFKPFAAQIYLLHFEDFWKYATRTAFIDVIIKRMIEKDLLATDGFAESVILNIKKRKGIGLKFILFDCVKAWLTRA